MKKKKKNTRSVTAVTTVSPKGEPKRDGKTGKARVGQSEAEKDWQPGYSLEVVASTAARLLSFLGDNGEQTALRYDAHDYEIATNQAFHLLDECEKQWKERMEWGKAEANMKAIARDMGYTGETIPFDVGAAQITGQERPERAKAALKRFFITNKAYGPDLSILDHYPDFLEKLEKSGFTPKQFGGFKMSFEALKKKGALRKKATKKNLRRPSKANWGGLSSKAPPPEPVPPISLPKEQGKAP